MRLIDADALLDWINKQREEVTKKQRAGAYDGIFTREVFTESTRIVM